MTNDNSDAWAPPTGHGVPPSPPPPVAPPSPLSTLSPHTTGAELAELAYTQPDLWPAIAQHPNVYPGLLDWIAAERAALPADPGERPEAPHVTGGIPLMSAPPATSAALAAAPPPYDPAALAAAPPPYDPAALAAAPPPYDPAALAAAPPPYDPAAHSPAAPHGLPPSPGDPRTLPPAGRSPARRTRRTRTAIIASVTAGALLIGGTAAALAATGVLGSWFTGGSTGSAASIDTAGESLEPAVSFAGGLERAWRVDSDEFVDARSGPDTASSWLGGSFDRLTFGVDSHFYPVASEHAVMFVARGVDSRLVLIDSATGAELWSAEIGSEQASCAPAVSGAERFYCVSAEERGSPSVLWEVTATGEAKSSRVAPGLSRVAVGPERIVLASMYVQTDSGSAVAMSMDGRELWSRSDLGNGSYYGIELAGERTLLREGGSWTLLDGDGDTIGEATGPSAYDGGDGGCDALLTPGGNVVVASSPAQCTTAVGSVAWGEGRDIRDVHAVTVDGKDGVLTSTPEGTVVRTFASDGSLSELWSDPVGGAIVGASGGDTSLVVVRAVDRAVAFDAATGETVSEWALDRPLSGEEFNRDHLNDAVLDGFGTTLTGDKLVDATSGEIIERVDLPANTHRVWLTDTGVLATELGCPECSYAGGSGADRFLSLYTPPGGMGQGPGSAVPAALPEGMPDCPATTVLLAWAEFSSGWVLVCGYDATTPSFVQVRMSDGSGDLFSVGSKKPGSQEAKAACAWDPDTRRFSATLEDGSKIVLDYDLGTLSAVDSSGKTSLGQERFVRYIFVPLGSRVRTLADTAGKPGAFDVTAPDDTAEDQVRYLIEVLERAYEGRALVKTALPKLQQCTASAGGYDDSVKAMEGVRDNRAELLRALDAMPVDLVPEGNALLDDLREAIGHSHRANQEYVAWAKAANSSGCAQLSGAGKAAAEASDAPKERFAERWNRTIAPKFGVRSVDPWFI